MINYIYIYVSVYIDCTSAFKHTCIQNMQLLHHKFYALTRDQNSYNNRDHNKYVRSQL